MRLRTALPAALVAAVLALSACSSSGAADEPTTSGAAASDGQFPVTIEHAFGETTIESKPERVATIQWANAESALALGVVPVGMAKQTYGDDDGDGILPWTKAKLDELGATTPTLYDETDSIDFEAVSNDAPDVILAAYSGITQEDYDTLSKIAPVVAYPDVAWATTWQDSVLINGRALGLEDEAKAYVAEQEKALDDAVAQHPALAGKTAMLGYIEPGDFSKVGYYTSSDSRVKFLQDFGFTVPASIEELSKDNSSFYGDISAENADQLSDVDVIVTYGDANLLAQMQADPRLSKIPAVAKGAVLVLENGTPQAAAVGATALSVPYLLENGFVDQIAAVAEKA